MTAGGSTDPMTEPKINTFGFGLRHMEQGGRAECDTCNGTGWLGGERFPFRCPNCNHRNRHVMSTGHDAAE